jgi:hypothetical protein
VSGNLIKDSNKSARERLEREHAQQMWVLIGIELVKKILKGRFLPADPGATEPVANMPVSLNQQRDSVGECGWGDPGLLE